MNGSLEMKTFSKEQSAPVSDFWVIIWSVKEHAVKHTLLHLRIIFKFEYWTIIEYIEAVSEIN